MAILNPFADLELISSLKVQYGKRFLKTTNISSNFTAAVKLFHPSTFFTFALLITRPVFNHSSRLGMQITFHDMQKSVISHFTRTNTMPTIHIGRKYPLPSST